MRKILIKGYYGYNNLGDDFILYSILDTLNRIGRFRVSVVSATVGGYDDLFNKFDNLRCREISKKKWRKLEKRAILLSHDYWIIGGGGLFPNERKANFLNLKKEIEFSKKMGKKICIYGIDINSIYMLESKKAWIEISKLVDFIVVRNQKSYDLLTELSCENVIKSSDVTFGLTTDVECDDSTYILDKLGIEKYKYNLWAVLMPWFPDEYNEEVHGIRYRKLIENLRMIAAHENLKSCKDVYLPFYYCMDMRFIRDLVKYSKEPVVICDKDSMISIDEKRLLFKYAHCNICMRFHSAMFSIYHENPGLIISYSDKTSDVIRQIGLSDRLVEYGIRKEEDFYKEFDLDMDSVEQILDNLGKVDKQLIHNVANNMKVQASEAQNILKRWLQ